MNSMMKYWMCGYDYQAAGTSELAGIAKNIIAAAPKAKQSDSLAAIAKLQAAYDALILVMKEAKARVERFLEQRAERVKDCYRNITFKVKGGLLDPEGSDSNASAKIIAKKLKPLSKIFTGNANTKLGNMVGEIEVLKKIKPEHYKAIGADVAYANMLKEMDGYDGEKQESNDDLLDRLGGTPLSTAKSMLQKAISFLNVKMRSVQANEDAADRDDAFTIIVVKEWQKAAAAQKTAQAIRKKKKNEKKAKESESNKKSE